MSWVWGFKCPKCGQDTEGMYVDKEHERLKDWSLFCRFGCGHRMEPGSYWLTEGDTIEEGWKNHCESLGWDPNER